MYQQNIINSKQYHTVSKLLRAFFEEKGYVEVATQSRLSILSACEDPSTIATFQYSGTVWPLKQTGQMDLEYELLTNTEYPGVFCQSTSYRQEANPIPGRHDLIFPMFEFEGRGSIEDLISLEKELLEFLGFTKEKIENSKYMELCPQNTNEYVISSYKELASFYEVAELTAAEEEKIGNEIAPVFFIKDFPEYTHPFWNMKRYDDNSDTAKKVDVILYGIETIGSAERETDSKIMLNRFHKISEGKYSELLYAQFGLARVMKELGEFLDLPMTPRFGGGIGMTRLIRAMLLAELI